MRDTQSTTPITLDRLTPGHDVWVDHIQGSENLTQRLRELGFYEGARVSVLSKMFFWGPIVVELDSCSLALRRSEAQGLLVSFKREFSK